MFIYCELQDNSSPPLHKCIIWKIEFFSFCKIVQWTYQDLLLSFQLCSLHVKNKYVLHIKLYRFILIIIVYALYVFLFHSAVKVILCLLFIKTLLCLLSIVYCRLFWNTVLRSLKCLYLCCWHKWRRSIQCSILVLYKFTVKHKCLKRTN